MFHALYILPVLFFTLSPVLASALTPESLITGYVEEGIVHFVAGELDEAILAFSESIKINPKDYFAYYHRAKAYENINDYDRAIDDYGKVISLIPQGALSNYARYYRGILYQRKGRFAEAIADYTAIIDSKIASEALHVHAYNNRGLVHDREGRYDKAISDFNTAIEISPGAFNIHLNRGVAYANYGIYSSAREDFNKELELNPNSFTSKHYGLALDYYASKDYHRSWFEVFRLMRSKQRVSLVLIDDLKKALRKKR